VAVATDVAGHSGGDGLYGICARRHGRGCGRDRERKQGVGRKSGQGFDDDPHFNATPGRDRGDCPPRAGDLAGDVVTAAGVVSHLPAGERGGGLEGESVGDIAAVGDLQRELLGAAGHDPALR